MHVGVVQANVTPFRGKTIKAEALKKMFFFSVEIVRGTYKLIFI